MPNKKCKVNKKSDELLNPPTGQMKNMFYSKETHQSYVLKVLSGTNEHATLLDKRYEDILGTGYIKFDVINSLTAIGPYMAHRFSWASFKANNFLNFCSLTTIDNSKCS
jgi:hypothetical protein